MDHLIRPGWGSVAGKGIFPVTVTQLMPACEAEYFINKKIHFSPLRTVHSGEDKK